MKRASNPWLGLGLAVPLLTVFDEHGHLAEADQRRLVAHVIAEGRGAGIVFIMGTTGEWNRVDTQTRHAAIRVSLDAVAQANSSRAQHERARAWVGVTAPAAGETLACIDVALEAGADALVIAPLAISGLADPVAFVRDEVAPRLCEQPDVPLYLYDNAEIAVDAAHPLLDAASLRALAALDCVHGIKISAPRDVVERAMTELDTAPAAARSFEVYIGYASLSFDIARSTGALAKGAGALDAHVRLAGLVPGAANVLPRAWRNAWEACWAGDAQAMAAARAQVEAFREVTFVGDRRPIVATLKRALLLDGVIESALVAPGTDALRAHELAAFDARYARVRADLAEQERDSAR